MAKNEGLTKEDVVKSQANYKGNSHHDLVKIKITTAGSFYKVGDEDVVHPATAEILKSKGLITGWTEYKKPKEEKKTEE